MSKFMRFTVIVLVAFGFTGGLASSAAAEILVKVDKSTQRMTVTYDGEQLYNWPVSTGRTGYATPSGAYTAFRMEADHYSKEWDDAPMPHSIFFTKIGHAIHGSYDTKRLGTPASHGCVRISPAHAATLFALVKKDGVTNTKVVLTGSEQVALAQRGTRAPSAQQPLDLSAAGYNRETTQQEADPGAGYAQPDTAQSFYTNRSEEFLSQGYAQPSYVNRNFGFFQQPQYYRPHY